MRLLQKVHVSLDAPDNHVASAAKQSADTFSAGTMCGTASVVVVDMCRFGAPTHSAEAALALPQAFPVFRAKPQ